MSIVAMIQDDGLTVGEVLSGIPHDGPAIVVYVIIAAFVGFIWWGSRSGQRGSGSDDVGAAGGSSTGKDRS